MVHGPRERERRQGHWRPPRRGQLWGVFASALLVLMPAACTAQIRLPKLDGLDAALTPAPDSRSDPARALPAQVAICVDRGARRCWSASTAEQCESSDTTAVFRLLARDGGTSSPGEALADCWKSVGGSDLPR